MTRLEACRHIAIYRECPPESHLCLDCPLYEPKNYGNTTCSANKSETMPIDMDTLIQYAKNYILRDCIERLAGD